MAEIASVTTQEKSLCVLQFPFMVTLPLLHALFSHYLALFLTFLLSEQHHGSIPVTPGLWIAPAGQMHHAGQDN